MPAPVTILWFRRDLRTADHAALASARGPVVPLFVAEPEAWSRPEASARQWRFVAECLAELRADLAARGAPLVVRQGEAVAVLEAIRAERPVARLVTHAEPGLAWAEARDARVAAWAASHGIAWDRLPAATRGPAPELPARLEGTDLPPGDVPEAAALGLPFDPCPERLRGGRAEGERLLAAFAGPETPDPATLDAHLAWGTISARELRPALAARLAARARADARLARSPDLDRLCVEPALETLRPRAVDCPPIAARLAAWEAGRTGLPIPDAAMRSLRARGWLPDPLRALAQGVASWHLWIDWRDWGPALARLETGHAPGPHWAEAQMRAGTDGTGAARIPDPVRRGPALDPAGAFVRRWVPELAALPAGTIHAPWDAPRLPRGYPPPIVDVAEAARAARARLRAHGHGAKRTRRAEPRQPELDL